LNIWKTAVSGKPLILGVPVIISVTVFCGSSIIFQNVAYWEYTVDLFWLVSYLCRTGKIKSYIHSCSSLSYDRSKAASKV